MAIMGKETVVDRLKHVHSEYLKRGGIPFLGPLEGRLAVECREKRGAGHVKK